MATVEITALDVLVLKKLVLINAALGKSLTDPRAAVAARLKSTVLAVRPRVSELREQQKIERVPRRSQK